MPFALSTPPPEWTLWHEPEGRGLRPTLVSRISGLLAPASTLIDTVQWSAQAAAADVEVCPTGLADDVCSGRVIPCCSIVDCRASRWF